MLVDKNVFVGIEIELENLRNYTGSSIATDSDESFSDSLVKKRNWAIISDGSLRNHGLEFVTVNTDTNRPLTSEQALKALIDFDKIMKKYIEKHEPPILSDRTSLHIHIDVSDMSIPQINKYILLYSIFEGIFFKWALPDRYYNNYCRPISLHTDVKDRISKAISANTGYEEPRKHFANVPGNKYDGINFKSIYEKGSLEFRLFRGTYNIEDIITWINLLLCLRKEAIHNPSFDVFKKLPSEISKMGVENLIKSIFGKHGSVLEEYATKHELLYGVRIAQDILFNLDMEAISYKSNSFSPKSQTNLTKFKDHIEQEIG